MNLLLNKSTEEVETNEESFISTPGDWFTSKEHYLEFIAAWKNWVKRGGYLNSTHFILYALLRNRQWSAGWTVPLNPNKVKEQHWKKIYAFERIKSIHGERELLAPFDGTVTTEMLIAIRENLEYIRKGPFGIMRGDK